MFPDRETTLCISVSARPSNFGMAVHNAAYRAAGLNFLYKAFGVRDIAGALAAVRTLGIRGCSVSMPFKEQVVPLLDVVDPTAAAIGAVNTIVNDAGVLTGYNTDAYGAEVAIARLEQPRSSRVLLLGAGGVARAFLHALRTLGYADVTVCNRSVDRLSALNGAGTFAMVPWNDRQAFEADLVINATPLGMTPDEDGLPIAEAVVARARAVVDVIVTPPNTRLVRVAQAHSKPVTTGVHMSLHQAARQFELYTDHSAPLRAMEESIADFLAPIR